MREVNISQLWGRAWDLFKVNGLLFVVLLVSLPTIIVILIPIYLLWPIFVLLALMPVLVRAGYLVARKGQSSFGEAFRDLSSLLKIFVYELTLLLIPWILLWMAHLVGGSVRALDILVVAGFIILFLSFFGWAAPYCVLSGRAGIFSAIGQSFSLTWQNFSKVFVALLSVIGLLILGLLLLGLGLLMEVPILILGGVLLCGLGLLVVLSLGSIFLPILYFALKDEEGVSHAKSLHLG